MSRTSVERVSRRKINKQLQLERSQSIPKPFKVIRRSKRDHIRRQGQENNQLDLSDCAQTSFYINSITNSTTCFGLSKTHRSHNRIQPIDSNRLSTNEFTLDVFERNRKKKNKRKKCTFNFSKICVSMLILTLLIGGFIGALVYLSTRSKHTQTITTTIAIATATAVTTTTTQNSVCTLGGLTCPTPMFTWDRSNNCTKPAASYIYYSCCYQAISNQLTIEFLLREDVSNWFIDDVSITQGNGELVINGGFESNLTGWTAISSAGNLAITPLSVQSIGSAHAGSSYLYSEAKTTFDRVKQTVNVTQGQNVNISFWWLDEGGVPGPTEICEASVTLTP